MDKDTPQQLRKRILELTREYADLTHRANRPGWENDVPFSPGVSTVPYAARVFDGDEVEAAVDSVLDFWLTLGPNGTRFESELAALLGVSHSVLVNSGSSANLIALTALTSHKIPASRRLRPGDEVITVAGGFPTTVAPIVQNGAVPVFVDNDRSNGNVLTDQLEEAFDPDKTRAVILAHTLGNPFDIASVLAFCRKNDLWLIEDNCDALGSEYAMPRTDAQALGLDRLLQLAGEGANPLIRLEKQAGEDLLCAPTGCWGDLSTQSFYPPHHLTMGEGGAVNIVFHSPLKRIVESYRDWGRDCWCASGTDNSCKHRFSWQLGELPAGYDHKYTYSHLGYNLKPLDLQAAIGLCQLKKLPAFTKARRVNWERLRTGLADLDEFFDFTLPTHALEWQKGDGFSWDRSGCRTMPSWFGFMLRVRPGAPFTRTELARHLDSRKIGNRMLFGGNLVRQPAFVQLRKDNPNAFRKIGDLSGADDLMNNALFLGTYPGLSTDMMDYELECIHQFIGKK